MKRLIKKILKEDRRQMFLDKVIKYTKNDFPLIKNLKDYGFYEQLSIDELNYVLSGILEQPVRVGGLGIYNDRGNKIYYENSRGYWRKYEYDNIGNKIYVEDSNGYWIKSEYDDNRNIIYSEDSYGDWIKYEYDERGRLIYKEFSYGYWYKYEYDERGRLIYKEFSRGKKTLYNRL